MSYTSYFYLLFFLGVLVALYYLIPLKKRWLVLLGGSYFFYWMASGKMIVFLLITTVSVYLGALAMEVSSWSFSKVFLVYHKTCELTRNTFMPTRKNLACEIFRLRRVAVQHSSTPPQCVPRGAFFNS